MLRAGAAPQPVIRGLLCLVNVNYPAPEFIPPLTRIDGSLLQLFKLVAEDWFWPSSLPSLSMPFFLFSFLFLSLFFLCFVVSFFLSGLFFSFFISFVFLSFFFFVQHLLLLVFLSLFLSSFSSLLIYLNLFYIFLLSLFLVLFFNCFFFRQFLFLKFLIYFSPNFNLFSEWLKKPTYLGLIFTWLTC